MPNNNDRRNTALSVFDMMSTEELQQILREDASKPEGEGSDMETILYVMEVLAKRRKEQNEGKSPEEALESFKSKYLTTNNNSFVSENRSKARKQHKVIRWSRGLVAAVAVLVILIGSSMTAHAMDLNLWDVIVKWTQETFHFGYVGQTEPIDPNPILSNPCNSLQEALDGFGITAKIVPAWLPNGYTEVNVTKQETPMQRRFSAAYESGENTIRIRIVDYLSGAPAQIEQSDTLVEVYVHNGVNYYIFDNHGQLQAVWTVDNLECYISGPITLSEIKNIIDSIGKG